MHPLFILLIVAGCLAVVGVAVAVTIKLVQNSRKKKSVRRLFADVLLRYIDADINYLIQSLSGLEYVELVDDSKRRF
jgi:hypothetical protein